MLSMLASDLSSAWFAIPDGHLVQLHERRSQLHVMFPTLLVLQAKGSDGSGYDGEDTGDGDTEDGTDNGGSSRRQKTAGAKRARLGGPSTSNPEMAGPSAGQGRGGSGGGNNSDPGAVASAMAGGGVYAGLDLLQAYQPGQYWGDPSQNEVGSVLAAGAVCVAADACAEHAAFSTVLLSLLHRGSLIC